MNEGAKLKQRLPGVQSDQTWMYEANCYGKPELFYSAAPRDILAALNLCYKCPVLTECRNDMELLPVKPAGVRAGVRWKYDSRSGGDTNKGVPDERFGRPPGKPLGRVSYTWLDVLESEGWVTEAWLAARFGIKEESAQRQMFRWRRMGLVESRWVELASATPNRIPSKYMASLSANTPERRREWRLK
jgi:hypothetical protein